MLERIQKIISAAGITSRRAAEQLILDGRVRVNGQVVTELGTKADALKDHIKVDGKLINPRQPLVYVMLNKPAGYVTTMADPEGRPTVLSLLKGLKTRVYPVGRLDYNTEGLLLLTNDGDFAHLITHPKHEFPKTYRAKVKGVLEDHQIEQLESGIYLDDGKTAPAKLRKVSKEEANSWLEITIHEGRKRQVRRMFDRVGHSVIKLKRIKTGNLVLGDLPDGAFRYLTPGEVESLKELAVKDVKMGTGSPRPAIKHEIAEERVQRTHNRPAASFDMRARGSRTRPDERRSASYNRGPGNESKWKGQGPRVPGQGASGRGPRRPPRDRGSMQSHATSFMRTGQKSMGTVRPGQESGNQGAPKSVAGKARGTKSIAARIRGKVFGEGADRKPGTERTTGSNGKDRKPRRSYVQHVRGSSTVQGAGRKPFRTRR
ncbi:MAG TPA: pseudouridine synthase [Nitrospirota bacterium]|nr:pseudouridine synthase [Nitrospirota bacterium]